MYHVILNLQLMAVLSAKAFAIPGSIAIVHCDLSIILVFLSTIFDLTQSLKGYPTIE